MPFLASRSTTAAASPTSKAASLKVGPEKHGPNPAFFMASRSCLPRAWFRRARCASPDFPSSERWMVAASAASPALVQMLDVAFSRRMCCSRVERVRTKPRRPLRSTVAPATRPGICRTSPSRMARNPGAGPPKLRPLPKLCSVPTATSAPRAPGAWRRPSETASEVTETQSAPARFAMAAASGSASITPKKLG